MKNLSLLILCTHLVVLHSRAEEIRDKFKVGLGFFGSSVGSGIGVDFAFSSLFNFQTHNDKARSDIHPYLELANEWHPNLAQTAGVFSKTQSVLMGAGAKLQTNGLGSGFLSPYTALGLEFAFLDTALSTNSTSVGMRAGIGADILFLRSLEGWFGSSDSTFFVEANLLFFHRAANKLAGSPRIREGFIPRIGFRTHF